MSAGPLRPIALLLGATLTALILVVTNVAASEARSGPAQHHHHHHRAAAHAGHRHGRSAAARRRRHRQAARARRRARAAARRLRFMAQRVPRPAPTPARTPAPSATPTATLAPVPASSSMPARFGFANGSIQNEDPTTLGKDLDALAGTHVRWMRFDINWAQIQGGGPASYNWTAIDRVAAGIVARGMRPLGVIVFTPPWARPAGTTGHYPPAPSQYAAFARAAVQHYSALGVHDYEIWNEPNITNFWETPDAAAYTHLLQAAYPAIKSVDPTATVVTGGTAPAASTGANISPVDFLAQIYADGGRGYFDAVGHHPYCWPAYPGDARSWSAWYEMYGTATSLRSLMVANGDGSKQIWATEFGAPTNGPAGSYISEAAQAQSLQRAWALWSSYSWAGPLLWYAGRDLGTTTDTRENFFGIMRNDFSPKPSYDALEALVAH